MSFRENLKTQLLFSNLKTRELAELSGVKKQTIDSYLRENGYTPSADAACKLARVLNVSVEYLITGEDSKTGGTKSRVDTKAAEEINVLSRLAAGLNAHDRKTLLLLADALKKQSEECTGRR